VKSQDRPGTRTVTQKPCFSDGPYVDAGEVFFASPADAAATIADVESRYPLHCEAARLIAELHFDARTILADLVDTSFTSGPPPNMASPTGRPGGSCPEP
jgi:hypothetical protein